MTPVPVFRSKNGSGPSFSAAYWLQFRFKKVGIGTEKTARGLIAGGYEAELDLKNSEDSKWNPGYSKYSYESLSTEPSTKLLDKTNMKAFIAAIVFVLLTIVFRCDAGAVTVSYENCKDGKQTDYCKLIFGSSMADCYKTTFQGIAMYVYAINKPHPVHSNATSYGVVRNKFKAPEINECNNCRVTCNNCAAYNCTNPMPESQLNCTAMESQCNDAIFGPFMKKNCPATCGTCQDNNGQLCKDVASVATCMALKAFCNSVEWYAFMTQQCPSTCNRCPTGACQDTIPNCSSYLAYCNDQRYDAIMRLKCAKTCNKCPSTSSTSAPGTCVDDPRLTIHMPYLGGEWILHKRWIHNCTETPVLPCIMPLMPINYAIMSTAITVNASRNDRTKLLSPTRLSQMQKKMKKKRK
uniref:ShKT domain-containing protein n=1 Tax=Toxocara canis TaxID=6265 RepID=A0A183V8H2_TOXCA